MTEKWLDFSNGTIFRFDFMAISDDRQKIMPSAADRDITSGVASTLAYKEAVRLIKPVNHILEGEVYKNWSI